MANEFDRIFKEESEILIKAIATKVLGITDFDNTEPVTATLHKTIEREPDWLRRVCHSDAAFDYIFHGEVQTKDEAHILDRNLVYASLLWSSYHLPIRQVVVYIGKKRKVTQMTSSLSLPNLQYNFLIINMYEIPYDIFINSNNPEEVILSVLCDFKGQSKKVILEQILYRLKELDNGGLKLEKHLVQLEIISSLRNLQPLLTKIMNAMPIIYDIRKDVRFKQGSEEGKFEGKIEGATIKTQEFIINLLENNITSTDTIANLVRVTPEMVEKTKQAYAKALTLLQNKNNSNQKIADETGLMLEVVQNIKPT
ncbi:MAG: hypothetical protein JNL70_27600 [Saprospiraceae bacterium]|nr:hypothetical protein [Saprospiraceae bacterium]